MARNRDSEKLTRLLKSLDDEDKERLAELLADGAEESPARTTLKSADSKSPSYRAVANPDDYERTKKQLEDGVISRGLI